MNVLRRIQYCMAICFLGTLLLFPTLSHADETPDIGHWHTFTSLNGLAGNIVQTIWEDPQGRIWFGTENGVSCYDGTNWKTYRTEDGLIDNNVWSISGDDESVWFATSNGLSRLDLENNQWAYFTTEDGLANNDVRAVLVGDDGTVWAGMFGGGVARQTDPSQKWEPLDLYPLVANSAVVVQSLWKAPSGDIWFGTSAFGAVRIKDNTPDLFGFRKTSQNTVWGISTSVETNTTWITTFRGIITIDNRDNALQVETTVENVDIPDTEVLSVAAGANDTIWFGTRAHGVLRRTPDGWSRLTTADGLSRNYVLALHEDSTGRVWFGTRGGGVTLLDQRLPEDIQNDLEVVVTARDVQANEELNLNRPVLQHDQNNLQFNFAASTSWIPSQDVSFRYWLESNTSAGFAPKIATSTPAETTHASSAINDFIDLPAGEYTLHVVPLVNISTGDLIEGTEKVYPFTIRNEPPRFNTDSLTVHANGQNIPSGSTLTATFIETQRTVELDFDAESVDVFTPIYYEYRLNNTQNNWTRVEGSQVTLTLPQGTHHVDTRAVDYQGNTSPIVTRTIIVPGPFWITVLTYLGIVLTPGILGSAAGVWWYRRWTQRQALLRAVRGHIIPYDVGPLITSPERYIGRQHVINTILGSIDNNSFYVYGEKRIGKTSLLAQLKQRLTQRNTLQEERWYLPVFRNIQDVPQDQFWHTLIRSIADAVAITPASLTVYTETTPEYNDFDAQDDLEVIVQYLKTHVTPRHPLIVLLLDEVDTFQRYDPIIRQRFRAFCQHMQEQLQVVLVGVMPPRAEISDTSPWANIFAPIALEPLASTDTLYLIRNYNQNPYQYTPEAEQALLEASNQKPFDTQWLCAESVKAMLTDHRSRVELADVEQAIQIVVGERRREYATFWQQVPADTRQEIQTELRRGGVLSAGHIARGAYDRFLEVGLVLRTEQGYRLSTLFQHWLQDSL